jgi:hypothetical protein
MSHSKTLGAKWLLFALPILPLVTSCLDGGGGGDNDNLSDSAAASTYDGEVARAWMNQTYLFVKGAGTAPPQASRIYGYCGIALYESCVRGMSDHNSLEGQLNELVDVPEPTNEPHHWPSVVNRCLAVMNSSFFSASQATIDTFEGSFDTIYDADTTIGAAVRARSIQYGEDLANAILTYAGTDGFATIAACNSAFVAPGNPGDWVGTGTGLQPCWGSLRTFVVADALECAPVPPPAFSVATSSEWYAEALQVYNVTGDLGALLTVDQTAIANYWADGATATGTPPGHWVGIVGVVTSDPTYDQLDIVAEAYARVGLAVADAFITCWQTKFDTYLQRPITYIAANIDAAWTPLLSTPNFPTYTSGHSTQSGAASTVLTAMFGPIPFTDTTHTDLNPGLGFTDRSFDNFIDAAQEAAASRLYGGIHYAFDNNEGFNCGTCIGNIINANVEFLK